MRRPEVFISKHEGKHRDVRRNLFLYLIHLLPPQKKEIEQVKAGICVQGKMKGVTPQRCNTMEIEENSMKGHSCTLFLIGRKNRLNVNRLGNGIAHSLFHRSFTRLHEELEPFETENYAPVTGGYASSSHSGSDWNLILEELS